MIAQEVDYSHRQMDDSVGGRLVIDRWVIVQEVDHSHRQMYDSVGGRL